MNKKQIDSKRYVAKRLVSAARAMIAGQVGFSVGCFRLYALLRRYNNFEKLDYGIFADYYKMTTSLPIGTPRLNWERKALMKKDKILDKINGNYKKEVFEACFDLIDQLDKKDSQ